MREEPRPIEDELARQALADVPPMSEEAFARGRAALLARMDADEAAGEDAGDSAAVPGGSVAAPENPAAAPEGAKVVPIEAARRRRRSGVRWLAAVAAVALLVGGALIGPALIPDDPGETGGGGFRIGSASAAAAEVLNQAAAKTGDVLLQPGQYLYVLEDARWMASGGSDPVKFAYLLRQKLETWIPADRRQEWLHRRSPVGEKEWLIGSQADEPSFPPMQVLGEWRSRGGPHFGKDGPPKFANPTPDYLAKLPRDPRKLYEQLARENVVGTDSSLLMSASRGLATGMIPADLRAALFKALTYLPNLQVVDKAVDLNGRTGTALGITADHETSQLVIDAERGNFLGTRTVQVDDWRGIKAGTVTGSTSVSSKVVSGLGAVN